MYFELFTKSPLIGPAIIVAVYIALKFFLNRNPRPEDRARAAPRKLPYGIIVLITLLALVLNQVAAIFFITLDRNAGEPAFGQCSAVLVSTLIFIILGVIASNTITGLVVFLHNRRQY